MSEHHATVSWQRQSAGFSYDEYNREHHWQFKDGVEVKASAAIAFHGKQGHVDPEEAFVAAVASCHMLTFLAICARKRLVVDEYEDRAVGYLEKNAEGFLAITRVQLAPRIRFEQDAPSREALQKIHHQSHRECFIANSVSTEISVVETE